MAQLGKICQMLNMLSAENLTQHAGALLQKEITKALHEQTHAHAAQDGEQTFPPNLI
jgi:hypothetical protein